jgi:NADH-quinone oxidoreductase subunit G
VEELFAMKKLMTELGSSNLDGRPLNSCLSAQDGRGSYLFNATIQGIEEAGAILLIGTNPRKEAPILNARIRKRFRSGNVAIASIGEKADLTYAHHHLGDTVLALAGLIEKPMGEAQNKMIIVGEAALNREDGAITLGLAAKLAAQQSSSLNILHTQAATVGALDVGFAPNNSLSKAEMLKANAVDVLFNFGEDEATIEQGAFVVYIGSHGDVGAARADVILPASAYSEKSATYVNMEGRAQMTTRATFPKGEAKEDWAIVSALAHAFGKPAYASLQALRQDIYAAHPHLQRLEVVEASPPNLEVLAQKGGKLNPAPFLNVVSDFYLTNPIARASKTLAECSAYFNPLKMAAE